MDLSSLTGMFVGVHMMLAANTGHEELMITPQEGESFMKAAQNVLRHYSVEATQKTLDWIAFAGISGGIYFPRIVSLSVKNSGKEKTRRSPATVSPLRPRRGDHLREVPPVQGGPSAGDLAAAGFVQQVDLGGGVEIDAHDVAEMEGA